MSRDTLPDRADLLWPTLKALESIGGSASIRELMSRVATDMSLPDEILDVLHNDGPATEVFYRARWARTYLKMIGAVDNTARGVWTITDRGRDIRSEDQVRELVRNALADRQKNKKTSDVATPDPESIDEDDEQDWEGPLLEILQSIAPAAFERLCQLILRESGFARVEVTGRSGDGGIDGAGVLRVNLISFHVRFQCKRYVGSVGAPDIRDFRGAMVGRADKGLFITTGTFTEKAQREAVRDGAPAIDLIDGSDLCVLLKKLELRGSFGVTTKITPKPEFFEAL